MSDITQRCPTCGRRPSEAVAYYITGEIFDGISLSSLRSKFERCVDRCHDLADLGPAAFRLLARITKNSTCMRYSGCARSPLGPPPIEDLCEVCAARAILAAAKPAPAEVVDPHEEARLQREEEHAGDPIDHGDSRTPDVSGF